MKKVSNIALKILGILLLIASVLKGRQLLTEPVANNDIWSYRPLLILTVEFELALAIWLLSGLFKKAAWLAALLCFSAFSAVTLYKALTGAESCGCFGSVHVNPWITLFAIDLPAVTALSIFRPRLSFPPALSFLRKQESIKNLIKEFLSPLPSASRFAMTAFLAIAILGISAPILAFNEPPQITTHYEVLEPKTWVGKELPILEYIDIAESLKKGTWLVLLYHYDCPDCVVTIPKFPEDSSNSGSAVWPGPGKRKLPLHTRQTGSDKRMVRYNPRRRFTNRWQSDVRLGRKSTEFRNNSPKNSKKP